MYDKYILVAQSLSILNICCFIAKKCFKFQIKKILFNKKIQLNFPKTKSFFGWELISCWFASLDS